MLRFELEPNGAFNLTEFGTVEDPAQFRAMHAYSPYHQVRDGTLYPSVLLLTGENDGRVSRANSHKMAARLQQANASTNPILVQLSSAAGHGMGTALAERIADHADVLAFLFKQLGMTQTKARDFERSV
jgi:prolyl oligopeptidase